MSFATDSYEQNERTYAEGSNPPVDISPVRYARDEKKRQDGEEPCPAERHNSVHAYNKFGCRCPESRRLCALQEKKRALFVQRHGHGLWVDGTGVTRRLRALCWMGHNTRALAEALGTTQVQVRRWLRGDYRNVHVRTRTKVRALYEARSMEWGASACAARTRRWAQKQGWAPPLAWDDDTIDDPDARPAGMEPGSAPGLDRVAIARALSGLRARLTTAERDVVVAQLNGDGWSDRRIGLLLGVSHKTVARSRRRLGLAGISSSQAGFLQDVPVAG